MKLLLISILLIGAAVPFLGNDYILSFFIQMMVFCILAYSWNIIGGYAGYTHFGQICFFGFGAYVGALMVQAGVNWLVAALCAGLAAACLALPIGLAMLRLKGPFFAIGMFGLSRVFESLALALDGITQGGTGLFLPPVSSLTSIYICLAVITAAMILLTFRLDGSRLGLQLLSIREDEGVAEALGVRTTVLKIGAFIVSAIAPGAVGSIYATYLGYIDPLTAFSTMTELTAIAMALLGGLGTVLGPLVGSIILFVANELLWSSYPEAYLGLVGVIMLATVLFMPRGVIAFVAKRPWGAALRGRSALRRLGEREKKDVSYV